MLSRHCGTVLQHCTALYAALYRAIWSSRRLSAFLLFFFHKAAGCTRVCDTGNSGASIPISAASSICFRSCSQSAAKSSHPVSHAATEIQYSNHRNVNAFLGNYIFRNTCSDRRFVLQLKYRNGTSAEMVPRTTRTGISRQRKLNAPDPLTPLDASNVKPIWDMRTASLKNGAGRRRFPTTYTRKPSDSIRKSAVFSQTCSWICPSEGLFGSSGCLLAFPLCQHCSASPFLLVLFALASSNSAEIARASTHVKRALDAKCSCYRLHVCE